VRLEVETHIVTASSTSVANLSKCVQRAGIDIDELVLAPLATAESLLSEEDRELGVALCDIGGDTTDVAIFQDGTISHCATIPMGARSVTSDLGLVLRVTPDVAESLKMKQGTALPLDVDRHRQGGSRSARDERARPATRRSGRSDRFHLVTAVRGVLGPAAVGRAELDDRRPARHRTRERGRFAPRALVPRPHALGGAL